MNSGWIVLFLGFITGTVLGSFIEAFSERIIKQSTLRGRSYCLSCKHMLQWYDLFPVLSYLFLKGKCRYCHKNIPRINIIVEISLGAAVALLFYSLLPSNIESLLALSWQNILLFSDLIFKLFIICVAALIFLVDLKTGLIHNVITYPAAIVTAVYLLTTTAYKSWIFYQGLLNSTLGKYLMYPRSSYMFEHLYRIWEPTFLAIISAFVAAGIFVLLIILTKGKGMGWGDVKYVFLLGLALGFPNVTVALFLSFTLGALFSLFLIAAKKKHFGQTIPFGPFLSLGAIIALLYGSQILEWYLTSFRLGY